MLRRSAASPIGSWARIRSRTASATSECSVTPDAKRLAERPRRQPLVAVLRIGVAEHVARAVPAS